MHPEEDVCSCRQRFRCNVYLGNGAPSLLWLLYVSSVRVVQPVRLPSRAWDDLVIEIFILRHEAAVRSRQVDRAALWHAARALLTGLWFP